MADNPLKVADCSQIIKTFQKAMMAAPSEEAVIGSILPKVSAIAMNSHSVSSNLSNNAAPPIPEALGFLFGGGGSVSLPSIDLPDLPDSSAQMLNATNWREWLEKCIPCNLRVNLRADLLGTFNSTLLTTLENMLNSYLKELAFVMNVLNAPDVYQDACLMLRGMNAICIPDLQRILSLLAMMLYRLTTKEIIDVDIMKLIVLPIFQPIFTGIAMLFSRYKMLVTDPLNCVVTQIDVELNKLKIADEVSSINTSIGNALDQDTIGAITKMEEGISQFQKSMGTGLTELRNTVTQGVNEVESLVDDLMRELESFVGIGEQETVDYLLNQYKKLKLIRMISFVSGLVKAQIGGFNCSLDNPDTAQETLITFFDNYLNPNSNIVVITDPQTGDVTLMVDRNAVRGLGSAVTNGVASPGPIILQPSGNQEIDQAVNAIITQATSPVSIKPKCFFEASSEDDNKLAQWIAELDATEV